MLLLLSGIVSTILSLLWAEAMYKSKVHSYVCSDKGVNCSDFMLWIWSLYSWGCSLMLLYSWIVPSESFFHTAIPQRNEGFQYFMSCCCFLFLCFCLFVCFISPRTEASDVQKYLYVVIWPNVQPNLSV